MGVDSKIPLMLLTDADFGTKVAHEPNELAKASEMEHAIRAPIREQMDNDQVACRKFDDHLRDLLSQLGEQLEELAACRQVLVDKVRAGAWMTIDCQTYPNTMGCFSAKSKASQSIETG